MNSAFIETIWQDMLYALRTMRKNQTFTAATVLTLALGIGATTAIFTVVYAVLLKPLGYHDPDRLVLISGGATVARFEAISKGQSYTEAGAFTVFTENVTLGGVDGPEPLKGARVSSNFLGILGIAPLAGHSFLPDDEVVGPHIAMISAELWRRRFGSDPRVAGATVRLAATPYTIIGVLPERFQFPFPDVDVWRPWQPRTVQTRAEDNSPVLSVFGRLRPNVTSKQAPNSP